MNIPMPDVYERNIGIHPNYISMRDHCKNEFAELDAAEQSVRLQIEATEETVAKLESEVPRLEQSFLAAQSFEAQRKDRVKWEEAVDKLFFVKLGLADLRIALAETQLANAQAKNDYYARALAERRAQLLPLFAEDQAIAHTAEIHAKHLRNTVALRGALKRQKEDLQNTYRQSLQRQRGPGGSP